MKKSKKIAVIIMVAILGTVLSAYHFLCLIWTKPGMSGFQVTNGVIVMTVFNQDYVKVGRHQYIYRRGSLHKIIENEYDTVIPLAPHYDAFDRHNLSEADESTVLKVGIAQKNGKPFKAVSTGITCVNAQSLYYEPYFGD